MSKEKILDFGEKIGGAKKDLYGDYNTINLYNIQNFNEAEKVKYCVKKNVFPKLDYEKSYEGKISSREQLMFYKIVYDSIPNKPTKNNHECYIEELSVLEEYLTKMLQDSEETFKEKIENRQYFYDLACDTDIGCINEQGKFKWNYENIRKTNIYNNKLISALQTSLGTINEAIPKKMFCITPLEVYSNSIDIVEITTEQKDHNCAHIYNQNGSPTLIVRPKETSTNFSSTIYDLKKFEDVYSKKYAVIVDGVLVGLTSTKELALEFKQISIDEYQKSLENAQATVKTAKARKKAFKYSELHSVERIAPDKNTVGITPSDYQKTFSFRGGEFGNWEHQTERQLNLDKSYDAFKDLAVALNVTDKDMSLGGKLAIAFGSRGNSNAMAHYEPERNVINLTKLSGSGCLAHEWGHAFDYYTRNDDRMRSAMLDVIKDLRYKKMDNGVYTETKYYKDSQEFDKNYSKHTHGYWASSEEMFARAFACYITDKLQEKNISDPYLNGHSEDGPVPKDRDRIAANQAIEKFILAAKEEGLLSLERFEPVDIPQEIDIYSSLKALKFEDKILVIGPNDNGELDYTVYDNDYYQIDGGQIDNCKSSKDVVLELSKLHNLTGTPKELDYDDVIEQVYAAYDYSNDYQL